MLHDRKSPVLTEPEFSTDAKVAVLPVQEALSSRPAGSCVLLQSSATRNSTAVLLLIPGKSSLKV